MQEIREQLERVASGEITFDDLCKIIDGKARRIREGWNEKFKEMHKNDDDKLIE